MQAASEATVEEGLEAALGAGRSVQAPPEFAPFFVDLETCLVLD